MILGYCVVVFQLLVIQLGSSNNNMCCITTVQAGTRNFPLEYKTIQAAIDAARPYDVINIGTGLIYESSIVINKDNLIIQGQYIDETIIDGGGGGRGLDGGRSASRDKTIFFLAADNVVIKGMKLQNGMAGILVNALNRIINNTIIQNCAFLDNTYGIASLGSKKQWTNVDIDGCSFSDCTTQIYLGLAPAEEGSAADNSKEVYPKNVRCCSRDGTQYHIIKKEEPRTTTYYKQQL